MNDLQELWGCCNIDYKGYVDLISHQEEQHLAKEIFNYKCKKCEKKVNTINDFNLHFFSNHVHYCLTCTKCNQFCIAPGAAQEHKLTCGENEKLKLVNTSSLLNEKQDESTNNKIVKIRKSSRGCMICTGSHVLKSCPTFVNKSPKERTKIVEQLNLCYKCFRKHSKGNCKKPNCAHCNYSHNILLCFKTR